MNWTRLSLITAPSAALTTAEVKAYLRIDDDEEDALITTLIKAATAVFDGPMGIGVAVMAQTWDMTLDEFPCGAITIPLGPVSALTHVKYYDGAGTLQTLASNQYYVDLVSAPARVEWVSAWPAPMVRPNAVSVRFVAGAADAASVPADLMQMIRMVIAHWYRNREAVAGGNLAELPIAVKDYIARNMVGRFA